MNILKIYFLIYNKIFFLILNKINYYKEKIYCFINLIIKYKIYKNN